MEFTQTTHVHMPLLAELEHMVLGPLFYKHAAPNVAFTRTPANEIYEI
jgi:hypothetical protein